MKRVVLYTSVLVAGMLLVEHYAIRRLFAFYWRPPCCDGVVAISQSRAISGGVTASDTAGFPVTIDAGGSYRLTTDLVVSDANTSAIEILKSGDLVQGVTIDLNGFRIVGPGSPPNGVRSSLTCDAVGSGSGVAADSGGAPNQATSMVTVRNGVIIGMGAKAIVCTRCLVDGVHATANGGGGIVALDGAVTNSEVRRNCGEGINTERASDNVVTFNKGYGIQANLIQGNVIRDNGGEGARGVLVLDNTIMGNEGAALIVANGGYGRNVIQATTVLPAGMTAVEVDTNVCNGNSTCP